MQSPSLQIALLFIALGYPSYAQEAETLLEVAEGAPLTVQCALRVEQRAEWRLEGGAPPADMRAAEAAGGGALTARLQAARARPQHAGRYTCGACAVRVRVRVLRASAEGAAPAAEPAAAAAPSALQYFDLRGDFALNCTLDTGDSGVPAPSEWFWRKNGTLVQELPELAARYELLERGAVFRLKARALEDDAGNYSCAARAAGPPLLQWRLHARPHAKLPRDSKVVEGQTLKITCKLLGKPYPPVQWQYAPDGSDNLTDATAALAGRASTNVSAQGVVDAELTVRLAERSDAGRYVCRPLGEGLEATTTLLVKDKYAALWPFLGICAEVLVLCAVILLYERRRTKPELDDSDTDAHDQKKS